MNPTKIMLNRLKKTFDYLLLTCTLTIAFAAVVTAQNDETLPTLRGDEAIEQLKKNGQFDSLKEAVKAARKDDAQTDEPTDDVILRTDRITAPDREANDYLGSSISMSGDTLIIGTPGDDVGANVDQGSAYIFVNSGTTWTQQAKLVASDGAASAFFGGSVSISGNTAIVGAARHRGGTEYNMGAAYIFVRSGTTWTQQQQITSGQVNHTYFGISVIVSGDTAIVGILYDVSIYGFEGTAFVYTRSGTTWTFQTKLKASDGAFQAEFAVEMAISGDTLAIGSKRADIGSKVDQGAVYIFVRSGTTWTQQAKITSSDGAAYDSFSTSVAISGNDLIVGARGADIGTKADQGAAYIFARSGTTWTQRAKLTAADGAANEQFGSSVAISGNVVVVGASNALVGAHVFQGAAYVYQKWGTNWRYYQKLTNSLGANNYDFFGSAMVISDETLIISAPNYDLRSTDQGAVFVFRNPGGALIGSWELETRKVASDGASTDGFGYSVALSGDTAIVGAPGFDGNPNTNQGAAYIFVRQGTAWIGQQKLIAADGTSGDGFGSNVAIYGNTAVIGAVGVNYGANSDQGAAYVFVRANGVWTEQQKLTSSDGAASDYFGWSVGIYGETIVVGASNKRVDTNNTQGAAYVFTRSEGIWTEQQTLTASDGEGGDKFGNGISISGDTVIIGAPEKNNFRGAAYVFARQENVWNEQQKLTASNGAAYDLFGTSVAVSGNIVVIGAYGCNIGANFDQGAAYVFDRSGTVWSEQRILTASDGGAEDGFGYSVGISGNKVLVGAYWDTINTNLRQGSAYVFTRSGSNWTQERLIAVDGATSDNFGQSVAIENNRILVGAPYSDIGAISPRTGETKNDEESAQLVPDQGGLYIFASDLAPTAAGVSISGQVRTENGAGLRNATVTIRLQNGEMRTMKTGSFGYYKFDDIDAGQTIIISVTSKIYLFDPQVINTNQNLTDINFTVSQ